MNKTLPAYAAVLLSSIVVAAHGADADAFSDTPDLKADVMRVYGVRCAKSVDDKTVKVVIGASCGPARAKAEAYRIVSEEDEAYAYEKFVRPTKVVTAKPPKKEFDIPAGNLPKGAMSQLTRAEVVLELPHPLKKGVRYSVVAQGEGGGMVTAGLCAASFTHGQGPEKGEDGEAIAGRMTGLRRVSNVGDGKILCEFGHGYSPDGGLKLANWKVAVNGEGVKVAALGRRSRLECYQPVGWPFPGFVEHCVFLDLARPLAKGDVVSVEVSPAVTAGERSASFTFDPEKSLSQSIKANQVGYLPDGPKIAYVGRWLGSFPDSGAVSADVKSGEGVVYSKDAFYAEAGKGTQEERENARLAAEAEAEKAAEAAKADAANAPRGEYDSLAPYALRFRKIPAFSLIDWRTGKKVYEGRLSFIHNGLDMDGKNNYSGENVYTADFTAFKTHGLYVLSVEGVGRSLPFEISPDVYEKAFRMQAQGVYEQRCGIALDPKLTGGWRRIACHKDGVIATKCGRWESGEWGKFTENMEMVPNPAWPAAKAKKDKLLADPARTELKFATVGATTRKDGVFTTGDSAENGVEAPFAFDASKGATVAFSARRDDSIAGSNWTGDLFSLGRAVNINVVWGVVKLGNAYGSRINDKKWHRFVVRVNPADEKGSSVVELCVDGMWRTGEGKLKVERSFAKSPVDAMRFAHIKGDVEGLSLDGIVAFARPLSDDEISDLDGSVPETLPLTLDALGGHHDAGDYNPRSHIDVAQSLLDAYELKPGNFRDGQLGVPERGNGIPDIVDEALWAARVWVGLQDEDGGVRNGTESQGDPNFVQTVELDDKGDYAWAKDTKGSYLAAGLFAQVSRVLASLGRKDDASAWLARARRAYEWAVKNPTKGVKGLQKWGEYNLALRAYAAAQLYHTTWEKKYHADFLDATPWREMPGAELMSHGFFDLRLAAYAYILIPREKADGAVWDAVLGAIRKEAEMYERGSETMAYKFLKHPFAPVTWGTGAYENYAIPAAFLWVLTGEEKWRDWLVRTCDNTLGANPMGLSWITGLGSRTVRCPLHNSRYRPAGLPVDGMQVEGPNKNFAGYSYKDTAYPRCQERFAIMQHYADVHFAIAMDEPVVNNMANTMMVFGLLAK